MQEQFAQQTAQCWAAGELKCTSVAYQVGTLGSIDNIVGPNKIKRVLMSDISPLASGDITNLEKWRQHNVSVCIGAGHKDWQP